MTSIESGEPGRTGGTHQLQTSPTSSKAHGIVDCGKPNESLIANVVEVPPSRSAVCEQE
ncbi:hypothetical protein PGTUg99_024558 [Puccinia graminis f. sp. tritici]|uniref:Uncharacterized protein n=1 Tax=Puccinia graminis f. sp. tritici TaxID=56615 RepID=A0A5B0RN53_PUCGR|nr:hypothetical protein PGTUg99_024558 [Puccinia graminis f. sp. tritici]